MAIEIGDRVRFKDDLPDREDPSLQHNVGWEPHPNGPGWGKPITRRWSKHFAGERGIVVSVDRTNGEATVRGRHHEGVDFAVQIGVDYLSIEQQGIPR